jgi:3D (Asp-Asp-Asp) domain-containing protein
MKKFLDAADKFTQYAFAGVLTLFAVACMFSGCKVSNTTTTTATPIGLNQGSRTTEAQVEETKPSYLDMGEFKLTAYCACSECCGKWADGITSTGTKPVQGRTIAVDQDVIPYGSEVIINGHTYKAEDCGGAIVGNRIDVYFDSHEEALEFGVQYGQVLLKVGDFT